MRLTSLAICCRRRRHAAMKKADSLASESFANVAMKESSNGELQLAEASRLMHCAKSAMSERNATRFYFGLSCVNN